MTSWGLWVVVLAGATTACGPRAKKSVIDDPAQVTLRKLDAYLQCHVEHSEVVFRTEDLYRLDFADGPPTPTRVVVLAPTPDPAKCLEGIAAARALQPAMPALEAAGAAYATELAKIHRLTTTYNRARAVELHTELMAAFDAFDRAQATLFDQIYVVNRTTHLPQLAQRETKEDKILILVEHAQLAAEDLVRFAAVPWDQLDKLDTLALAGSIAALERAIVSVYEFERQEPDAAHRLEYFYSFRDHSEQLVTAARQLARRARDNVPYTDAEKLMIREGNATHVVGTPAALAHAYNRVAEPRAYVDSRAAEPR